MAISSDINVNTIVDSFQTVAGATAVVRSVVAECRPGVHTGQEVVRLRRNVRLFSLKSTVACSLVSHNRHYPCERLSHLFSSATLSFASASKVVGCLNVVRQLMYGSGKEGSMGWNA